MTIKLLSNWILVNPRPVQEQKSASGRLVLPQSRKSDTLSEAVVYRVGPGRVNHEGQRIPVAVKTGELVLWRKTPDSHLQHTFRFKGESLVLITEDDIIAVIDQLPADDLPEWLS